MLSYHSKIMKRALLDYFLSRHSYPTKIKHTQAQGDYFFSSRWDFKSYELLPSTMWFNFIMIRLLLLKIWNPAHLTHFQVYNKLLKFNTACCSYCFFSKLVIQPSLNFLLSCASHQGILNNQNDKKPPPQPTKHWYNSMVMVRTELFI